MKKLWENWDFVLKNWDLWKFGYEKWQVFVVEKEFVFNVIFVLQIVVLVLKALVPETHNLKNASST